jgi:hypothetical protein
MHIFKSYHYLLKNLAAAIPLKQGTPLSLSHPPTVTLDQPEASYGPPFAQTDLAHLSTPLSEIKGHSLSQPSLSPSFCSLISTTPSLDAKAIPLLCSRGGREKL